MQVHRELGFGFLGKVYENAMMIICKREKLKVVQQAPMTVYFLGGVAGEYYADIIVDGKVVLELKAVEKISDAHRTQTLNYLKATGMKPAIILNFGKESFEYERLAY